MTKNDPLINGPQTEYYNYVGNERGYDLKDDKIKWVNRAEVRPFTEYSERSKNWSKSGKSTSIEKVGASFTDWKNTAEIAPTIESTVWDLNVFRNNHPAFVFLDCGRWKGTQRNFGLVWGRHVYLCSFELKNVSSDRLSIPINLRHYFDRGRVNGRPGNDLDFFQHFQNDGYGRIIIHSYSYANWGNESDYEWEHAYVIISDLHLMTVDTAKVWYSYMSPFYFNLDAEVDLMYFAEDLIKIKNKLKIIQIGDCYDLWVNLGLNGTSASEVNANSPLFKSNEEGKIILVDKFISPESFLNRLDKVSYTKSLDFLRDAIREIQTVSHDELTNKTHKNFCDKEWLLNDSIYKKYGHAEKVLIPGKEFLNPAEVALKRLQNEFGKSGMQYIYGNHDNYLIDTTLTDHSDLWKRQVCVEDKTLFVEHPHRLEAYFSHHYPKNYDGCESGFKATTDVYYNIKNHETGWGHHPIVHYGTKYGAADGYAADHDQPVYRREFAKFWLGRKSNELNANAKKPPNIFVIGHTHMPALYNVRIALLTPEAIDARIQGQVHESVETVFGQKSTKSL
jgi:hypothetical protein